MCADHRPLSDWVTDVEAGPEGSASMSPYPLVNSGADNADARLLPRFASGWRRTLIDLGTGAGALGLVREGTREAVVELDEMCWPLTVTPDGTSVVRRIEENWPADALTAEDAAILADEEIPVRYYLIERLSREGRPAPELFHLLPWDLVDRLVEGLLDDRPSSPRLRLRHWFRPVGTRFSVGLEQLDEGIRADDMELWRRGSTVLCARLIETDVARIPPGTRDRLARLMRLLGDRDPFLAFSAELTAHHLGQAAVADQVERWLSSTLDVAAAGQGPVRVRTDEFSWGPYEVNVTVVEGGWVTILVEAEVSAEGRGYGTVLLRIAVISEGRIRRTYLMPLLPMSFGVRGTLSKLRVPGGDFHLALASPPLGSADIAGLDAEELDRSVRAADENARQVWRALAERLPPEDPLHDVLARCDEGTAG
ncbi:hypothetical protein [Actinomadura bangladeshensis]|uniref:Uncharacterized protein n=1 Tax=Actinomadura bangladeshensis TaxID=453573 RepID=A0A6L9QDT2_9ACTN|nr:hypothetical protein [Actinomadura bangladeshensis]NEA23657.1 hypothetical protein [Actinomadura bangladeshensis]